MDTKRTREVCWKVKAGQHFNGPSYGWFPPKTILAHVNPRLKCVNFYGEESNRLRCRVFLRAETFQLGRLGFHAKARLSVLNQQAADAAGSFMKFQ